MNVITAVCGPGTELYVAEPVRVGDVLAVGAGEHPDLVHVAWASGDGPCRVFLADPHPYAGLGYMPRRLLPGEPVRVAYHHTQVRAEDR